MTDKETIARLESELLAERQRREQVERVAQVCYDLHKALGVKWGEDPYAAINTMRQQLLSALAAISYVLESSITRGPEAICECLDKLESVDLSALREHDAELWRMLIDGKPRAICKACGYPELIGSDDCRKCGKSHWWMRLGDHK